jgi:hypothetical protein
MSIEDNQGRENDNEPEKREVVYFDKHPTEYAMEASHRVVGTLIHALHCIAVSASAKEVLLGYLDLSYQSYHGSALPPGREMARKCGMSHTTYLKSKRELIDVGIIYIGEKKGSSFADYSSPERIHVRDFVVKFLDHETVVQKLDHGNIVGGQTRTLAKTPKDGVPFNVESSSSILNSSLIKNPRLPKGGGRDPIDEAFDEFDPFADPVVFEGNDFLAEGISTEPTVVEVKGIPKHLRPFKLTPPPSGSLKKPKLLTSAKKHQPSLPVDQAMLNRMLALCYGITTTEQWVTVDKTTLQRCSAAVGKLIQARANFTQWDDWVSWWSSFATARPSPETVVRTWFKGVGNSKTMSAIKTGLVVGTLTGEDAEQANRVLSEEAKLAEAMLRRANG